MARNVSRGDVAAGIAIVRGVFEGFAERALSDPERYSRSLHTIKKLNGLLLQSERKQPRGRPQGRRVSDVDLRVIKDEARYGSIPKAVKEYCAAGFLSRSIAEKSHVDRINAIKRNKTSEVIAD